MCTVSFIPKHNNEFVFTSNRDEAPNRDTLPPEFYDIEGVKVLFPKDEVAGGTWIGASNRSRIVCLLNGGFEPHERADSYRLSRGVIVKELLVASNIQETINQYNFEGIEPFTIIIIDYSAEVSILELVWDGNSVHLTEKPFAPHIWSSSLLYSKESKRDRENWFSTFIFDHLNPSPSEILSFHKNAGDGDMENNLIMDRGFVKTKSITQLVRKNDELEMHYLDLETNISTKKSL